MTTISLNIPDGPVLIAGPTASGKSALALRFAEEHGGQIINADAFQVYECWRVLTARPDDEDLSRAPHHLYGHVSYEADYSVGHWLREIKPLLESDFRPIIVGGTGLYFTALTEGLAEIPAIPEEVRKEADEIRTSLGHQKFLTDLSKETLSRIDTQNPMRVQRAWEVWRSTGRQISVWQDETPPALMPAEGANTFVLDAPKEWLNERISRRFNLMLEQGALEEARRVLPKWNAKYQASKAIGAPELMSFLRGDLTLEAAAEKATVATRQYAKRQRTWFRARMKSWKSVSATQL